MVFSEIDPWRDLATAERRIGRFDEMLKNRNLFENWISAESRLQAVKQMAYLGEKIHIDHLCDFEIGQRAFARLNTNGFRETLGTRRALLSLSKTSFPIAPGPDVWRELYNRCLATYETSDQTRGQSTVQLPAVTEPGSASIDDQDFVSSDNPGGITTDADNGISEPETEGHLFAASPVPASLVSAMPIFDDLADYIGSLPADGGLFSVSRGVQYLFQINAGSQAERGFTHLAFLSVPMLIRRFCGTTHSMGFIAAVVARNSQRHRGAVYASDEEWNQVFLAFLTTALQSSMNRFNKLKVMAEQMEVLSARKKQTSNLPALIALLVRQPVTTVAIVARELGVSTRTANQLLGELKQHRFLNIRGNRDRYRVWQAYRFIELMESAE